MYNIEKPAIQLWVVRLTLAKAIVPQASNAQRNSPIGSEQRKRSDIRKTKTEKAKKAKNAIIAQYA